MAKKHFWKELRFYDSFFFQNEIKFWQITVVLAIPLNVLQDFFSFIYFFFLQKLSLLLFYINVFLLLYFSLRLLVLKKISSSI